MTEAVTFTGVIDSIREHTAHLLGTTISYDEDDWAEPTALAGWTRSHIAAHLVEEALNMIEVLRHDDASAHALPSAEDRQRALERRALDAGIELQIELDETSGQLQDVLAVVGDDELAVTLSGGWEIQGREVPLVRLREVVVHHFDLIGEAALDVDDDMAQALLALEVRRPRSEELPPVLLVADEGFSARIGDEDGETTTVLGPANDLLIWLARGITTSNVSGTADLEADISHPS
ncbi:MAG: maleylpyruvate isomerase family mycothiol-dependent enzyme [Propionibacterium sp.]|nr:maleylpyruvate isomerase family mycothiol-dependent enzyme [Propionibacterium sp.]